MDKIEVAFDYMHFKFDNIEDAIQFYNLCTKSYDFDKVNYFGEKKSLMLSMVHRTNKGDSDDE